MKKYEKLVRDLIPKIISQNGAAPLTHIASEDEFRTLLYRKLREEADEVAGSSSLEEMADLCEVIRAICALEGWSLEDLEEARLAKVAERGAFEKRIVLESVS